MIYEMLNDDVAGVISSFIPVRERVCLLRDTYTNDFLMEGLKKKTIKQLDVILHNIIKKISSGDLRSIRNYFNTTGVDLDAIKKLDTIGMYYTTKWINTCGNKNYKIKKIIDIIQKSIDIISCNKIEYFEYFHSLQFTIVEKKIVTNAKTQYNIFKMLCLIVSIVKQPKKREIRIMKANIM